MPIYKDEEIEVMSKAEALWVKVKENAEVRLKISQESVIIETALIEMAKKKIKDENNSN